MEIQKDFKELFECFNVHCVSYLIVGGYAMAFHGFLQASPSKNGTRDLRAAGSDGATGTQFS
jgi:hypothetical protein